MRNASGHQRVRGVGRVWPIGCLRPEQEPADFRGIPVCLANMLVGRIAKQVGRRDNPATLFGDERCGVDNPWIDDKLTGSRSSWPITVFTDTDMPGMTAAACILTRRVSCSRS